MRACGLQCRTDLAAELVEYLYTGSIAIPMQRATELLSLADRWQIRGGTPVQGSATPPKPTGRIALPQISRAADPGRPAKSALPSSTLQYIDMCITRLCRARSRRFGRAALLHSDGL